MVSKSLKLILITSILFMWTMYSEAATQLSASVDRNPVMEREAFVLEIVANDSLDSSDLNLNPLDKTDFIVGRTATSSQTQIVNGSISKTTTWTVVLTAKQAGEYVIPALSANNLSTKPIAISVIKASKQTGQNNEPIFLKNNIESTDLYLQQTVKLVSRLYFSPNVELQSGSLTEPVLEGAFIKQQGKDNETSEIIMGVRYRVIERIYTVTPQASGQFVIKSPAFNGEIATGNRRRFFSGFSQTKPVTAFGEDISITVNPIPESYTGTWLASELVQLNEEWQPNNSTIEVGEAITRTFTLTALNVNEEQLPTVNGIYPDAFKVYPDQSEAHEVLRQNALVAQRVSSEAIVANKAGTYTLPEIKISWFNTKMKRQEFAILPEKQITVVAASGQSEQSGVTNLLPNQMETINAAECKAETGPAAELTEPKWYQNTSFTVVGWLLWLITVALWLINRTRSAPVVSAEKTEKRFDIYQLKQACKNNDPKLARINLLAWAQYKFSDVRTLDQLHDKVPANLQREIRRLNLSQYSTERTTWQGDGMWKAIVQFDGTVTQQNTDKEDLPPLN
ncbi:BatD family protein [Psychrosphaera sp. 1_MG-2023]|uniref:BatD family protein n=1 Tax=Psychrosphaera sp. 1_MG-2023 TaxID=3062643 RepID=UPI0026E349FD|nr:BatD family protein [Psychrosphaera sp. 1_MG-2023]MDO6719497.1 BatD family protein [Psychrosphaera sp. 1_MG-2023]